LLSYIGSWTNNYINLQIVCKYKRSDLCLSTLQCIYVCQHCNAYMWYQECIGKSHHMINPNFQLCCSNGKIELSMLKKPPDELSQLLFQLDSK